IRDILVPEENRKDVPEIPAKIRGGLHFTFVKSMDEVVREALLEQVDEGEGGADQETKEPAPAAARSRTDRAVRPSKKDVPNGPNLWEIESGEENLPLPEEVHILPEELAIKFQGQEPSDPYLAPQG